MEALLSSDLLFLAPLPILVLLGAYFFLKKRKSNDAPVVIESKKPTALEKTFNPQETQSIVREVQPETEKVVIDAGADKNSVESSAHSFKKTSVQPSESFVPTQDVSTDQAVKSVQSIKPVEAPKTVETALAKSGDSFFGRIRKALSGGSSTDVLDELEEVLYTSDLGPQTVEKLLEQIKDELKSKQLNDQNLLRDFLFSKLEEILKPVHPENENIEIKDLFVKAEVGPTVLMVVGVNGAGKTTTIGKLSAQLASQGFKVLVAAGDTFRAAAGGQLKGWTDRAQQALSQVNQQTTEQGAGQITQGLESSTSNQSPAIIEETSNLAPRSGSVEIFWPENATDPAAVAYDALTKAKSLGTDYVIVDTAGRLHTQAHLMEELKKVKRVMSKVIPEAPHNTWIVLDANSGQNALLQAHEYNKALELSGVVITKMDGTAKGGVLVGVVDQLQIPVKLIGIGEGVKDLRTFYYPDYIRSMLQCSVN